MDDVAGGAIKHLSTVSSVTSLLGTFPATDTINVGKPFLFKGDGGGYRGMLTRVQSTSSAALVLSAFGSYSVAQPLTTPRFHRLSVEVFIDPLRDANLNIIETSGATEGRGRAVLNAVFFALQRTNPDTQAWGDMVTTGCQLLSEAPFLAMTGGEGDGLLRGQMFYGVDAFSYTDVATG